MIDVFYSGLFFTLGALAAVIFAYVILTLLQAIIAFISAFVTTLINHRNKS